jgi:hypothetical protein
VNTKSREEIDLSAFGKRRILGVLALLMAAAAMLTFMQANDPVNLPRLAGDEGLRDWPIAVGAAMLVLAVDVVVVLLIAARAHRSSPVT